MVGLSASEPWLIELPWCSHTVRPASGTVSTAASVRRATSSVISLCGSQISTSFSSGARPVKRSVSSGPGRVTEVPAIMSMVRTLPPVALARAGESAVDEEVVDAVGSGWRALVGDLGGQHVQLDGGGRRTQHQAYAGGLRLGHRQLVVGDLLARPGRQPVGEHPLRGGLQVEGPADHV